MVQVKRFYVKDGPGIVPFEADTTQEVFDWLKTNRPDPRTNAIFERVIGCKVDNIDWVTETDFMQAFEDGECPGDLQFF